MNKTSLKREYFEWMCALICDKKYIGHASYNKLLKYLNNKKFAYIMPLDENRLLDGLDLRFRFADENSYYIDGDCSILEMMVALSLRCEEHIMSDDEIGNRTGRWFWEMIDNLGLESMYDDNFDKVYADKIIYRFLNREYEPNGDGGLFTIHNRNVDLRKVEIWYQLMWYLDEVIGK